MKSKIVSVMFACGACLAVSACAPLAKNNLGYWQRVEDNSALYMTGPKAQQQLEENIAGCVREIDELVQLDAVRRVTPPDTHSEYRRALDASGDLSYYNTPSHLGHKKVSHSDYHDFEGCMRSKGWERVKYIRYQTDQRARQTYAETKQYRDTGEIGDAAVVKQQQVIEKSKGDYSDVNQ